MSKMSNEHVRLCEENCGVDPNDIDLDSAAPAARKTMAEHNADAPNTAKIDRFVAHLKRLRAEGSLEIGWDEQAGEVPPTAANALVKAGLARTDHGVHVGQTLFPV